MERLGLGRMFVDNVLVNPHETITHPLGSPMGYNGLCHMLSAIMLPTKMVYLRIVN